MTNLRTFCLLALLVGCDSFTKVNPNACCTTQEDCDAIGLPLGTDCAADLACVDNGCVVATCQASSDCDAALPFCTPEGSCVECLVSSDCVDGVCDPVSNECRLCVDDVDCPGGFCHAGTCRLSIVPEYLPTICDTADTRDRSFSVSGGFDTDDPLNCDQVVMQSGGPDICVVRGKTITLLTGVELRVVGSRALALVADIDVTIDGTLDVSARGVTHGPGGGSIVSGGAPAVIGGGGAGFRTSGAPGGSNVDGGAGNGGQAVSPSSTILHGGTTSADIGRAGGAGGAATLIACRGSVSILGIIDAGGGGGRSSGFFQTYTPVGTQPSLTPATASPGFEANREVGTR